MPIKSNSRTFCCHFLDTLSALKSRQAQILKSLLYELHAFSGYIIFS
jgi:hypothetical protein